MADLERMIKDIETEIELTRHYIGKSAFDTRVMDAMRQVPRHEFLPEDKRYLAYDNGPVPIGSGQTISQPYIVALMSDLLDAEASDAVLEIGTGSGYQAAVLSKLVSKVYSLEIIENLAVTASKLLRKLGYDNIEVRNDNGYYGWEEYAPFDGIIVTAAAPHIPKALTDQLCIGARLVIPIGLPYGYQELMVFKKNADHTLTSRTVLGVRFVPMTGIHNPQRA
ncbi:MAG: protein-L-isoaspartate(D-aspartate) O-methyltransferase [Gammaproteobacteria bacterium]